MTTATERAEVFGCYREAGKWIVEHRDASGVIESRQFATQKDAVIFGKGLARSHGRYLGLFRTSGAIEWM